jgi:hypothetical protein
MPKSVEILVGPLRVDLNEERILLFNRRAPGRLHLTAYHEAREKRGDDEKIYTPHLTAWGKPFRWFRFAESAARDFTAKITVELFPRWVAASKPVSLHRLHRDNWWIAVADEALFDKWRSRCLIKAGTYRMPTDVELTEFAQDMLDRLITPLELRGRTRPQCPLTAMRERADGTPEYCYLCYYPARWPGGPAGWYTTPMDWINANDFFSVFLKAAGPGVRAAIEEITRQLGLGSLDEAAHRT